MTTDSTATDTSTAQAGTDVDVDAVVLGAGFSGVYMLKRLRDNGFTARAFEAGTDVGGTWYWNRYPGARCDSDSTVYCYSDRFDPELAATWRWSERYPEQKEIQRYIAKATDDNNLRDMITFKTRVESAEYDEDAHVWVIKTDGGETVRARFLLPAIGALTKPNIINLPGQDSFKGEIHHTARMPENFDMTGRKVAVIGAGATAVQIVPMAARVATEVHQLQLEPSHCLPGRNHELDEDDYAEIAEHRGDIWNQARANAGGFPYPEYAGAASEMTPEQQREVLEKTWNLGGLVMAFGSFSDTLVDEKSNQVVLDFLGEKIRNIVKDPETARKLTPTTPFCSKRPPIEHGYYAAFNRDNVHLHDISDNPIAEVTETGITLADGTTMDVDIILLATGFDAFTGALRQIDIRGVGGARLADHFSDKYDNFLGISVAGFPNMLMQYCGPLGPGILTNGLTLIEEQGEWIVDAMNWMRDQGVVSANVTEEAQDQFTRLHDEISEQTLIPRTASWWTGANIEGKKRSVISFCGGFPAYRELLDQASQDYSAYELTRA